MSGHAVPPGLPQPVTEVEIPDKPDTVEGQVQYIVELMCAFRWQTGRTGTLIAKKWGLHESTVRDRASEASRYIKADKDEAVREITEGARRLFRQCVEKGDAKGAKFMGELWANIANAMPPKESRITNVSETGEATPKRAAELVRQAFGEHAAKLIEQNDDDRKDDPSGPVPPSTAN